MGYKPQNESPASPLSSRANRAKTASLEQYEYFHTRLSQAVCSPVYRAEILQTLRATVSARAVGESVPFSLSDTNLNDLTILLPELVQDCFHVAEGYVTRSRDYWDKRISDVLISRPPPGNAISECGQLLALWRMRLEIARVQCEDAADFAVFVRYLERVGLSQTIAELALSCLVPESTIKALPNTTAQPVIVRELAQGGAGDIGDTPKPIENGVFNRGDLPNQGSTFQVIVSGGPGRVEYSSALHVAPLVFGPEPTMLSVSILPKQSGAEEVSARIALLVSRAHHLSRELVVFARWQADDGEPNNQPTPNKAE